MKIAGVSLIPAAMPSPIAPQRLAGRSTASAARVNRIRLIWPNSTVEITGSLAASATRTVPAALDRWAAAGSHWSAINPDNRTAAATESAVTTTAAAGSLITASGAKRKAAKGV